MKSGVEGDGVDEGDIDEGLVEEAEVDKDEDDEDEVDAGIQMQFIRRGFITYIKTNGILLKLKN